MNILRRSLLPVVFALAASACGWADEPAQDQAVLQQIADQAKQTVIEHEERSWLAELWVKGIDDVSAKLENSREAMAAFMQLAQENKEIAVFFIIGEAIEFYVLPVITAYYLGPTVATGAFITFLIAHPNECFFVVFTPLYVQAKKQFKTYLAKNPEETQNPQDVASVTLRSPSN